MKIAAYPCFISILYLFQFIFIFLMRVTSNLKVSTDICIINSASLYNAITWCLNLYWVYREITFKLFFVNSFSYFLFNFSSMRSFCSTTSQYLALVSLFSLDAHFCLPRAETQKQHETWGHRNARQHRAKHLWAASQPGKPIYNLLSNTPSSYSIIIRHYFICCNWSQSLFQSTVCIWQILSDKQFQ